MRHLLTKMHIFVLTNRLRSYIEHLFHDTSTLSKSYLKIYFNISSQVDKFYNIHCTAEHNIAFKSQTMALESHTMALESDIAYHYILIRHSKTYHSIA